MSAIVEIKVPVERTEEIIRLVWEVEKQVDTVVAHRRGHALRRERRGERGRADSGAAGLQTGARQDQHRPGPDHQHRRNAAKTGGGRQS